VRLDAVEDVEHLAKVELPEGGLIAPLGDEQISQLVEPIIFLDCGGGGGVVGVKVPLGLGYAVGRGLDREEVIR